MSADLLGDTKAIGYIYQCRKCFKASRKPFDNCPTCERGTVGRFLETKFNQAARERIQ